MIVQELTMKYTILLLVWVPPAKAEPEKKAFIWDCDPRGQDSRRGLVKQGSKEANTSLHASVSWPSTPQAPPGIQSARDSCPSPLPAGLKSRWQQVMYK